MKAICLAILFCLIISPTKAQLMGARNLAMGDVSTSQHDVFSALQNIATLATSKHFAIGITSQSPFLLEELQKSNLQFQLPLSFGGMGFRYFQYGFYHYHKRRIEVAYSIPFNSSISVGLKLNFLWLQMKDQQLNQYFFYPDLGLNYSINEKWELGLILSNISLSHIQKNSHLVPLTSFLVGIIFRLNPHFTFHFETLLNIDEKLGIKCAFEYYIHKKLYLRSGINSAKKSIAFGFGISLNKWNIDIATSYHSFLGFSPAISLSYASIK